MGENSGILQPEVAAWWVMHRDDEKFVRGWRIVAEMHETESEEAEEGEISEGSISF